MKFKTIISLSILFSIPFFSEGQNLSREDSLKYFFKPSPKVYSPNELYIRCNAWDTFKADSIFYIYSGIDIFDLDSKYKEYSVWTITSDSILEESHVSHSGYKSVDTKAELDTVIKGSVYPNVDMFRIFEHMGNVIIEINNGQSFYRLTLLSIAKRTLNGEEMVNGVWGKRSYYLITMRKDSSR